MTASQRLCEWALVGAALFVMAASPAQAQGFFKKIEPVPSLILAVPVADTKAKAGAPRPAAAIPIPAPKAAAKTASKPERPAPRPAPNPRPKPAAPAPAVAAAPVPNLPAQQPAAASASMAKAPATLEQACGRRVFLALTVCMQKQCTSPVYSEHPNCKAHFKQKAAGEF